MRVARWGNSLAVRLPKHVVDQLSLKEGDEVAVAPDDGGRLIVMRDRRREDALARLRAMRIDFPADYKFDREEANERGGRRA